MLVKTKELAIAPGRTAAIEGIAELPLIVKADVAGSVDAILHEFVKITHERASVRVVASGVGSVSENDVKTAHSSGAVIIAFNVGTDAIARDIAERDNVSIFSFSIISCPPTSEVDEIDLSFIFLKLKEYFLDSIYYNIYVSKTHRPDNFSVTKNN